MFLELDDNSQVRVTKEGELLREVIDLKGNDKQVGKKFFQDSITYIYNVYKRDHMMQNYSLEARKKYVLDVFLPSRKEKAFEDNPRVQSLIKIYVGFEYLPCEWFYKSYVEDYKSILKQLREIPPKIKIKVKVNIGDKENPVFQEKVISISNWEERAKAMAEATKIMDREDAMRIKVKNARRKEDVKKEERIFDTSK